MAARTARRLVAAIFLWAPLPLAAAVLPIALPEAAQTSAEKSQASASHAIATGPWADGRLPSMIAEGTLHQIAWRIEGSGSTLSLLAPLREQLRSAGYEILFECETGHCGGFDFRFGIDTFLEPEMHVDLGDFRYLSARREGDMPEVVSLLVSRSSAAGFVQLAYVSQAGAETEIVASTKTPPPASADLAARLQQEGSLPLEDLQFEPGAAKLSARKYSSLAALADFLNDNPNAHVTLVGHSDAAGGLPANVALSRRRASAVRDRLVAERGVNPAQLAAEGVGYLAPRAGNGTQEGRLRNRRVEAVLSDSLR